MIRFLSHRRVEKWGITCHDCGVIREVEFEGYNQPEQIELFFVTQFHYVKSEGRRFTCLDCQQTTEQIPLKFGGTPVK